ncbi:hypothetical protein BDV96DRAFT_593963 [Lophiotrema nucula]|uniref:Uncharacterized protein n=1 Tax=Lophiotrema nucula TaxID=690887 RepID=A0A6A5ZT11_9PLEO|nr:hypothetical protein BDV96DRAFT_593963 [Lophiotrema nucula]
MGTGYCKHYFCNSAGALVNAKDLTIGDLKNAYMYMGEIYIPQAMCEELNGSFSDGNCDINDTTAPEVIKNLDGIHTPQQLCELFGTYSNAHCTLPLQATFGDTAAKASPETKAHACGELGGTWQDNQCLLSGDGSLTRRGDVSKIDIPGDGTAQIGEGSGSSVKAHSLDCIQLFGGFVIFMFFAFGVKLVVEKVFKKREQTRIYIVDGGESGYTDKVGMVELG